jgi:hypothetical protein
VELDPDHQELLLARARVKPRSRRLTLIGVTPSLACADLFQIASGPSSRLDEVDHIGVSYPLRSPGVITASTLAATLGTPPRRLDQHSSPGGMSRCARGEGSGAQPVSGSVPLKRGYSPAVIGSKDPASWRRTRAMSGNPFRWEEAER